MSFADETGGAEPWLAEHRKLHPAYKDPCVHEPQMNFYPLGQDDPFWAPPKPPVLPLGQMKQLCPICGEEAYVNTFRDARCLPCQVQKFLENPSS